jgi:hypothetical protein
MRSSRGLWSVVQRGGFPGRWLAWRGRSCGGSLDGPGVGPVPALRVEVLLPGDVGLDRGAEVFLVLRGERSGRWPGG